MNFSGKYWKAVAVVAIVGMLSVVSFSAQATDQKDLTIGLKTFPLLENKIVGNAVAAIIYDPANPSSKADAEAIRAVIDAGLMAPGGVTITAVMVPVSELSKLSTAKLAFVASGTKGSFDAIGVAAAAAGILTISADLDCVRANKCVLGVVSSPSVEIYYSKHAGDAAKVSFSQAFTMLVKEI